MTRTIALIAALALAMPTVAQPTKPLFGRHKAKAAAVAPATVPPPGPLAIVVPPTPSAPPAMLAPPPPATVAIAAGPIGLAQVRAAYVYALPLYEMMLARHRQFTGLAAAGVDPTNFLYARTALLDAKARAVTMPNNDTLYASAWLDLASGPVILDAPAIPSRYHSAALMDVFTNNVAVVGTRTGSKGGRYLIAGPGWNGEAPPRTTLLRSPSNDAWLLIRVLVNGPADLPAATGLTRGFSLEIPQPHTAPVPVKAVPTSVPDAANFLAVVGEALARNPLSPAQAMRPELAALGISAPLPAETLALWDKALPKLRAETSGGMVDNGTTVDGWTYPGNSIGNYGDSDDLARARVALGGLAALPRTEAMYLTAAGDKAGAPLTGAKAYTVHLPANLPVGAFWSLTMYEAEASGRLFFVDAPRFLVGDRTPDLRAERDGSYDIFVQPKPPSGERVVNWLPAPKGKFVVVFRAYLPKEPLLDGSFRLPPVEVTEVIP